MTLLNQHPRAAQLRDLAFIVALDDDISKAIVNIELAKLVEETWDYEHHPPCTETSESK